MNKKIIITGASGFIGRALIKHLEQRKYEIIALTRNPAKTESKISNGVKWVLWDAKTGDHWWKHADNAHAIINLAGEGIASGFWTSSKKQKIIESRTNSMNAIVDALANVRKKPKLVIQASAIGFYGNRGDEILNESSSPGEGFLAHVVSEVEEATAKLKTLAERIIIFRIGLVLGKRGGLIPKIIIPFRLFMGGHLGDGSQWMSWIHVEDLARITEFCISNEKVRGVINLTSPNPLQSKDFFKFIGENMHRPSWFHIPGTIIKNLFGEMGRELFLTSQKVLPQTLINSNFQFNYPLLNTALNQIFNKDKVSS